MLRRPTIKIALLPAIATLLLTAFVVTIHCPEVAQAEPASGSHVSDKSPSPKATSSWVVETQEEWQAAAKEAADFELIDGTAKPTKAGAVFESQIQPFSKKQQFEAVTFKQTPHWGPGKWSDAGNLAPINGGDAAVFLSPADGDYWYFNAVKNGGEYHAWHSTDLKDWQAFGNVTGKDWVTTAEFLDGKFYIYYDRPNDEDPHLIVFDSADDLAEGKYTDHGMVFSDPSPGSDMGVFRDLDGSFHMIYEDWSAINARRHSWDSQYAGHTSSSDGIHGFTPHKHTPPIDLRGKPTGDKGTYVHPPTGKREFDVHDGKQDAWGDYELLRVGDTYYLFADDDPHDGKIGFGYWYSDDLYGKFTYGGQIRGGQHPDPTVGFAEGEFVAFLQGTDVRSRGPWADGVEAQAGVDVDGDGTIDEWTEWRTVKEEYSSIEGFAKCYKTTPAALDLSELPAGYAVQFKFKTSDPEAVLDRVEVTSAAVDSAAPQEAEETEPTSTSAKYTADWKSMDGYPVPQWFDDAKFGIFIHWGPYSVMGYKKGGRGYAEHTPSDIYNDQKHHYPWMEERFGGHPPEFGYKDVVPMFKAEKWNPDQWADLFDKAGARYIVLTAEHHDGYAMWDSDLTDWCATKIGPKRDLVGDLGKAVRAHGMKYAPSYHRERHPSFFAENGKLRYSKVYSEPLPDIAQEIELHPEAEALYGPFSYDDAFLEDYVARWQEIQQKYQPDFMWLDDIPVFYRARPHEQLDKYRQACAGMIANFLNDAAERNQPVYLNNKGGHPNWPVELGCREKDNMQIKQVGPKWENPATLGTSYGYLQAEEERDAYKSPTALIHLLCDVVSKNGNLLLNIGPKADGTIPEGMQRRLLAMGEWLEVNGEAIYGTRPWEQYQEKLDKASGPNKPSGRHAIDANSIRFTRSADGSHVYCILLSWPDKQVSIQSLAGRGIAQVQLLGSSADLEWSRAQEGIAVELPEAKPCEHAHVLKVTLEAH
ncbi:alpha-L-fucosidase [Aeoliella sp. ICT_H6.2]|uniref:alpha-L-fucosidase n=1 Tax=Aeoliella straminimaris TaxID=2954799 RepID=A0A9X2FFM6_9BACT|nr:alpha-L-fucosidase [Aeoliella straminimaris]MCO6048165.1 alpha-L-fucosidase [Aeoliella straminimaris]